MYWAGEAVTLSISPNGAKSAWSCSDVIEKCSPPTYSFMPASAGALPKLPKPPRKISAEPAPG